MKILLIYNKKHCTLQYVKNAENYLNSLGYDVYTTDYFTNHYFYKKFDKLIILCGEYYSNFISLSQYSYWKETYIPYNFLYFKKSSQEFNFYDCVVTKVSNGINENKWGYLDGFHNKNSKILETKSLIKLKDFIIIEEEELLLIINI